MDDLPDVADSPRRRNALVVIAIFSYLAVGLFAASQADPALRMSGDMRYVVVLWLLIIGGSSAVCWLARPHLAHVQVVFEVGRRLPVDAAPKRPDRPAQLAVRRAIWRASGASAACAVTLAAAIDIGAATNKLNLHGQNLDIVSLVILSVAVIAGIKCIVGPDLSKIDEVYQAARAYAQRDKARAELERQEP